jgi:branched-chain amino acid transport system substrate-binding protein
MNIVEKTVLWAVVIGLVAWGGVTLLKKGGVNQTTEPISIGVIAPLTGDAAAFGDPIVNSFQMAADDINSNGGINGRQIQLIKEDGKCSGKDSTSAAQKLINIDKVKIIIGGACSGELLAIAPIAEANKVIVISPSASNPDITNAGDYRNSPSDAQGGADLADMMIKSHKKVAIISENTDYAQGTRVVFNKKFQEDGGTIVSDESYLVDTKDFRTIVSKIKSSGAEAIIINPQSGISAGMIMNQIRDMGLKQPVFGLIILSDSDFIKTAGKHAEGVMGVSLPILDPKNQLASDFLSRYRQKYGAGNAEFYMAGAYDIVNILGDAIKASGGVDTEKIKNYLYKIENYNGLIGTYEFDQNGDLSGIRYVPQIIKDGKAVELK